MPSPDSQEQSQPQEEGKTDQTISRRDFIGEGAKKGAELAGLSAGLTILSRMGMHQEQPDRNNLGTSTQNQLSSDQIQPAPLQETQEPQTFPLTEEQQRKAILSTPKMQAALQKHPEVASMSLEDIWKFIENNAGIVGVALSAAASGAAIAGYAEGKIADRRKGRERAAQVVREEVIRLRAIATILESPQIDAKAAAATGMLSILNETQNTAIQREILGYAVNHFRNREVIDPTRLNAADRAFVPVFVKAISLVREDVKKQYGDPIPFEYSFKYLNVENIHLDGADLRGVDLSDVFMANATLRKANLTDARLAATVLTGSDLQGARLNGATLINGHLEAANLSNAHLVDADLQRASLWRANVTGTGINTAARNLQGTNIYETSGLSAEQKRQCLFKGAVEIPPAPQNSFEWNNQGVALYRLGIYNETMTAYDQALKLNPQLSQAWYNKGLTFAHLKEYGKALIAYDQALDINPEDSEAWHNKGIVLHDLGRSEEALAAYDQALKLNPELSDAWNNKGITLDKLGRFEDAFVAYDQALKLNPEDSIAWGNKGEALEHAGKYEEAIVAVNRSLELNSKSPYAFVTKTAILCKLGNFSEASETLKQALLLNPSKELLSEIHELQSQYPLG